jgi:dCTP deaminase
MCVLSDGSLLRALMSGVLVIRPWDVKYIQPCSYDLHLAQDIDLEPFESALADTVEWIEMPPHLRGTLAGRSSVARLFVQPHCQGGYIDPGFHGTLTLEITNLSREHRHFDAGDRLLQMEVSQLDKAALNPYHGRYLDQSGPTSSRFGHGDN